MLYSLFLPLPSCQSCIPLLIRLPFLRSLLKRMFFLTYAYYVVALSLFLLVLFVSLLLVFFLFVCLFFVLSWRRCLRNLLSCPFPSVCFPCFISPNRVPGLICFGSVYLVTTARFVVDQFMRNKQKQQQRGSEYRGRTFLRHKRLWRRNYPGLNRSQTKVITKSWS